MPPYTSRRIQILHKNEKAHSTAPNPSVIDLNSCVLKSLLLPWRTLFILEYSGFQKFLAIQT